MYDEYAKQWRFAPNVGKSKVMVRGVKRPPSEPYTLEGENGKETLDMVQLFPYLGAELQRDGRWGAVVDRLLQRARRAAGWLNAVGLGHYHFSAKTGSVIFRSMARSVVDFGADVIPTGVGRQAKLERFQRAAGRRILGCPARTPHEVVYGELGWRPDEYRRADLRMRFLRRLTIMDTGRAVYRMFRYRKRKHDAAALRGGRKAPPQSWSGETVATLRKYGLQRYWSPDAWELEEFNSKAIIVAGVLPQHQGDTRKGAVPRV